MKLVGNVLTCLTARFAGSVDGDFDGLVVGGHLRRTGAHRDGQREAFT